MEQGDFGGQYEAGMSNKHSGIFGQPMSAQGSSLCENSNAELARRKFVSITLNRKEQHWQSQSKQEKGENNSAHSLLAHVCTRVGSKPEVPPPTRHVRSTPKERTSSGYLGMSERCRVEMWRGGIR